MREIVRAKFDTMAECYREGLKRDAKMAGSIEVALAINDDGTVLGASAPKGPVKGKSAKTADGRPRLTDEKVVACVEGHFQKLRFPETGRGLVNLVYTVVFKLE